MFTKNYRNTYIWFTDSNQNNCGRIQQSTKFECLWFLFLKILSPLLSTHIHMRGCVKHYHTQGTSKVHVLEKIKFKIFNSNA